ncbi:MAG TPA: ABC transporter substrate-binding protein [Candidatus Binatia bacterium]|nr:ABC transporter substrate-binding protein [Candidatus Binatia bacterium]
MNKALAAWLLVSFAAAAPSIAPSEVVQSAVTRVVKVLEEATLNQPGEPVSARPDPDRVRAELRRIAAELFDFDEISRRALSRHWAARTRAEQQEFIVLFTDLLERTYLGKIVSYSGEKIVYTGEAVQDGYATVRSRILTRRGRDTRLDYRLHLVGGRWKVYDILIDGVSFVSTYRSQFNHVIQSASWNELMDRLRKRRLDVVTVGRTGG